MYFDPILIYTYLENSLVWAVEVMYNKMFKNISHNCHCWSGAESVSWGTWASARVLVVQWVVKIIQDAYGFDQSPLLHRAFESCSLSNLS